ncbi:MAG: T9SS type A sorting domain-containing protein [candidate division Zixibacteria bacterium]|nr:T9SS type A sorting domain-containing protein [candidate division Zixibacteria bacterium]MDD5425230.1 T9SS type A sorting domain-containing protein [candidate division Zixibacteria bacterium]
MKVKLLLVFILLLAVSVPVFGIDKGSPDSLILVCSRPDAAGDHTSFKVELYYWIDSNTTVLGHSSGFAWQDTLTGSPYSGAKDITIDSARGSATALATFGSVILVNANNYAQANIDNRFMFFGINVFGTAFLPISQSRQLLATYYFTIDSWTGSDYIYLDTFIWYSGVNLKFADPTNGDYAPIVVLGNQAGGVSPLIVRDPSDVQGNEGVLPVSYSLMQNYPNPFNPMTTILFDLARNTDYTLTIYNVLGQKVEEFKEYGERGRQTIEWNASQYASGIYFYKLETKDFVDTKKMILLK